MVVLDTAVAMGGLVTEPAERLDLDSCCPISPIPADEAIKVARKTIKAARKSAEKRPTDGPNHPCLGPSVAACGDTVRSPVGERLDRSCLPLPPVTWTLELAHPLSGGDNCVICPGVACDDLEMSVTRMRRMGAMRSGARRSSVGVYQACRGLS